MITVFNKSGYMRLLEFWINQSLDYLMCPGKWFLIVEMEILFIPFYFKHTIAGECSIYIY